ncbi:MAG: hypothetical protein OXN21_14710 [Chloroflexota bacterium]|nr:hypothetical protein [Chloroflexota bacterium]
MNEAGNGHAVDERDVTNDGAAEAHYRLDDFAQPEREVNGGAPQLIMSDGAGT